VEEAALEPLNPTLSLALDPSQLPRAKKRVSAEITPYEVAAGSFLSVCFSLVEFLAALWACV